MAKGNRKTDPFVAAINRLKIDSDVRTQLIALDALDDETRERLVIAAVLDAALAGDVQAAKFYLVNTKPKEWSVNPPPGHRERPSESESLLEGDMNFEVRIVPGHDAA